MLLEIELVPESSWYNNLRKKMTTEQWDKIRKATYAKYSHQCGICSATGMLHCHEIWEYDDAKHIQHLKGFIALCPMCHHVKHIGFAQILAERGELDMNELENHFMKVNKCSLDEFIKHEESAWEKWDMRGDHSWKVDFGEYKGLITE